MNPLEGKPSFRGAFPIWGFFAICYGWTWFFWSIPLLFAEDVWSYPDVLFIYLGGIGPPLAGVVMTILMQGRGGLVGLWQRLTDFRRISPGWYLLIFLLVPSITAVAVGIDVFAGSSAQPVDLDPLSDRLTHPLGLLSFVLFVFILGPLPEEVGWRGYALDRLLERWNALTASVVLGIAWGVWHTPLFLMKNYYQEFGGEPPDPIWFLYAIVLNTILITWIYNNTRRSVLAAVLFHFMLNVTGELLPVSSQVDRYKTILTTGLVIVVVLWFGPRLLRRRGSMM